MNILIVDSYNILFRSYYGLPDTIINKEGEPINALQGVFISLANTIRDFKIDQIECVMEGKSLRRRRISADYKSGRLEKPEKLELQIKEAPRLFKKSGFTLHLPEADDEADDVIATRALQVSNEGHQAFIMTNDKDLEAVLSKNIHIIKPGQKLTLWTPETLMEKKGILPHQVSEYLALIGDDSDNVPGVEGIGPVSAVKVLKSDNFKAALEKHSREPIKDALRKFELAKELTELCIPCPFTTEEPTGTDPVTTLKEKGCIRASDHFEEIINGPKQTELF